MSRLSAEVLPVLSSELLVLPVLLSELLVLPVLLSEVLVLSVLLSELLVLSVLFWLVWRQSVTQQNQKMYVWPMLIRCGKLTKMPVFR